MSNKKWLEGDDFYFMVPQNRVAEFNKISTELDYIIKNVKGKTHHFPNPQLLHYTVSLFYSLYNIVQTNPSVSYFYANLKFLLEGTLKYTQQTRQAKFFEYTRTLYTDFVKLERVLDKTASEWETGRMKTYL